MTFLNAILLGGLATALIPVIIHLLHRRRYKVVRWGAMDFLEEIFRVQQRRIRLEEWLLLAVRAAILGLLAFLMARPVLTGRRSLMRQTPTSLVVLLDNSLSMQAGDELRSHFSVAVEEVSRIVRQLPRGSEVTVIGLAGPLPLPMEPTHDLEGVAKVLATLSCGDGQADIARGLEAAAGIFARKARHSDRELVLVSDFQPLHWSVAEAEWRQRALQTLAAQPLPVRRVLLRPALTPSENISVAPLEVSSRVPGVGQNLRVRATIRNHGTRPQSGLRAHFRVNGEERSVSEITLGAEEQGTILFSHRFERPGSQLLEVEVNADRLRGDNTGRMALEVLERLPVLIVAGRISAGPLEGDADYLQRALRPAGSGPAAPGFADLIEPRVVSETEFSPRHLDGVRVVILANVAELKEAPHAALEQFVRDGGGLLIFPGDRARLPWYHQSLFREGEGLLPAAVTTMERVGEEPPRGLVIGRFEHPALELFNHPGAGGLSGIQVKNWYRLEPGPTPTAEGGAQVMVRLDTNDPFLLERRFGEGRVVLCAVPAQTDWSNLPLRPSFVPLIQEITRWAASILYPPRNVRTGERLVALLPPDTAGQSVRFTTPDGAVAERAVEAWGLRARVVFEATHRSGVYLLDTPAGERIHFTVAPPAAESDIGSLDDEGLRALARDMDAVLVRSAAEYQTVDRRRRYGRELWPWLLAVVVALTFVEIRLGNRLRGEEVL